MFKPYKEDPVTGLEANVPSPMVEAKRLAIYLKLLLRKDAVVEQQSDHTAMVSIPGTDILMTFKPIVERGGKS